MRDTLAGHQIPLEALYFCPHTPEAHCRCRKPAPGMILDAIRDFELDPLRSLMIGDKAADILAGERAGTGTVFITGKEDTAVVTAQCRPGLIVNRLTEAVDYILTGGAE